MINEVYVSYEIAMLLKEKGFREECKMYWWKSPKDEHIDTADTDYYADFNEGDSYLVGCECSAPTLQTVLKWLREIHGYEINVEYFPECEHYRDYSYKRGSDWKSTSFKWFDTWEACAESAIKYILEYAL